HPVPHRHGAGHRPDPPGHHHGGEYGDRPDYATGGPEPVRDVGCDGHDRAAGDPCRHAVAGDPDVLPDADHLRAMVLPGTAKLAGPAVRPAPAVTESPAPAGLSRFRHPAENSDQWVTSVTSRSDIASSSAVPPERASLVGATNFPVGAPCRTDPLREE